MAHFDGLLVYKICFHGGMELVTSR